MAYSKTLRTAERTRWINVDGICSALLAAFEAYGTALCGQVSIHSSMGATPADVIARTPPDRARRNVAPELVRAKRELSCATQRRVQCQH